VPPLHSGAGTEPGDPHFPGGTRKRCWPRVMRNQGDEEPPLAQGDEEASASGNRAAIPSAPLLAVLHLR